MSLIRSHLCLLFGLTCLLFAVTYVSYPVSHMSRIRRQEGALRALTNLLDSPDENCANTAAAALANVSYWSDEGVRRLSRFHIYCAL